MTLSRGRHKTMNFAGCRKNGSRRSCRRQFGRKGLGKIFTPFDFVMDTQIDLFDAAGKKLGVGKVGSNIWQAEKNVVRAPVLIAEKVADKDNAINAATVMGDIIGTGLTTVGLATAQPEFIAAGGLLLAGSNALKTTKEVSKKITQVDRAIKTILDEDDVAKVGESKFSGLRKEKIEQLKKYEEQLKEILRTEEEEDEEKTSEEDEDFKPTPGDLPFPIQSTITNEKSELQKILDELNINAREIDGEIQFDTEEDKSKFLSHPNSNKFTSPLSVKKFKNTTGLDMSEGESELQKILDELNINAEAINGEIQFDSEEDKSKFLSHPNSNRFTSPLSVKKFKNTTGLNIDEGERENPIVSTIEDNKPSNNFKFSEITNEEIINQAPRRKLQKAFKDNILEMPKNFTHSKKLTEEQTRGLKKNTQIFKQRAATINNNTEKENIYNRLVREFSKSENEEQCRELMIKNSSNIALLPKNLQKELREFCESILE